MMADNLNAVEEINESATPSESNQEPNRVVVFEEALE